jgi:nucleoside ABC transporter membrane protein
MIAPTAQLPILLPQTQVHTWISLGLVAKAVLGVVLVRSPPDYQIETVGQNPIAAPYAGISGERIN